MDFRFEQEHEPDDVEKNRLEIEHIGDVARFFELRDLQERKHKHIRRRHRDNARSCGTKRGECGFDERFILHFGEEARDDDYRDNRRRNLPERCNHAASHAVEFRAEIRRHIHADRSWGAFANRDHIVKHFLVDEMQIFD